MWIPSKVKKQGVALYNWKGDARFGLPLEIGDTLQILEECPGWYRGFCTKNRTVLGIFPSSYIGLRATDTDGEAHNLHDDPTVRECTQVLREWGYIWKKLYVEREAYKFTTLRKVMLELLGWRRALLGTTLTLDQTRDLKLKAISKIDWGNRKLGLDLVPRRGSEMIDPVCVGAVELYQVHVSGAETLQATSSRGTLRRKGAPRQILTHHLYFCMRDFGHRIGDDAEVFFSLFDARRMRGVSERFLVKISKDGFSNYIEKLHSNCTIFTDLGNADLTKDLYLVAHVMRIGKMMHSESSKKYEKSNVLIQTFRRPYGVAVLSLSEIISSTESEEKEYSFKVYQVEEKDFFQLHELIIKKQNNKFSPLSGQPNYGIVISLKMLHGELHQVKKDSPILFKNICLTGKMGFPDVIMPGDVRNDLYLILERGEFERGGKSTGKNIEVTVVVLNEKGMVLDDCLWGASGTEAAAIYQSMIIYHHNSPNWNETIRLAVPIELFYNAHIRLEYRHCSTRDKADRKLFGFSFARLMESGGATLQDGAHDLYIYKCEDIARLSNACYLRLPSSASDNQIVSLQNIDASTVFHRSPKEVVTVRTLLCSTKLTQNVDLLSLLQWKEHPERIQVSLTRALRLGDEELVKFLQDVLDALFAMFSTEDGNSTSHSGLVFHVLVSIFSLLDESKFQHFKPVMDAYIEDHFAAALVYKGLLSSVQHCADWVANTEKQEPIQKCFKSLEYILKLIIQSRKLFARATGGQYEDSFKRDLFCVFNSLNKMLTISNDVILPTQEALLHSVGVVLEQLGDVLSAQDVGSLASGLLDSVPRDGPAILIQAKLCAVRDLVCSNLFKNDESRSIILVIACKHLRIHLNRRDELKLCAETLGEVLKILYHKNLSPKPCNSLHRDLDVLCINTLDMLIQTVMRIMDRNTPVLGCLVACLLGTLQLLDEYHYRLLWDDMTPAHDRKPLKDFLHRTFIMFKDLISQDIYPNDWLVMKMAANSIIRKSLEEFAKPLVYKFLDQRFDGFDGGFDTQLWSSYFSLAVAFLTQPSLQLEMFSEVKQEKIIEKYGDMRVLMGFQILSMWSQLGEHKLHFIPFMVGPFLEVTLVPEPELRKATLHIFYDMMHFEQRHRGSFKLVESELIDKLDILISENKGDDEYRQLFNTMEHLSAVLLDRVETECPPWKDSGIAFIVSVTRLLERLLDYRSVMQGHENRDKRMSCTVNLLNFYKNEINRKEMYLRYIYKLHDLHMTAENFTEAGFTMKLYADQLSWDSDTSLCDPNFPGQTECERKETLYHQIIHYFDKGKCWEKGIPLCKELAQIYEMKLFEYGKLSNILKTQAKFCENILSQLRPEPEYFRVGFYGLSFPLFVRNKQFVYRGLEYERIGAFTQRLQTEFPTAQILTKNSPPSENILNSEGQFIQICNVRPLSENPLTQGGVPDKISRFYQVNDITRFQCDRPIHKGLIDKDNEFKSLWIERTTLEIASSLPGILRWFEVVDRAVQEIAPVQFACEIMNNVARELAGLLQLYTAEPRRNINPFSMRLQGIIDANVMGGISKYQEAFFSAEFLRSNQDEAPHVSRLKGLIHDQLEVLESALILHGQLAPKGVQPLHRRLLERFSQLKQSLGNIAKLKRQQSDSIVNTPLPPLPTEKRAQSLQITSNQNLTFDNDDIYTNPMEPPSRETLILGSLSSPTAPPIPHRDPRPRSSGFSTTITTMDFSKARDHVDSPEVPPKPGHSRKQSLGATCISPHTQQKAPPLPPRGHTPERPDKRASNPIGIDTPRNLNSSFDNCSTNVSPSNCSSSPIIDSAPIVPKRSQKYSIVDIALDESDCQERSESNLGTDRDFRDSGISTASLTEFNGPLNNFNNISYDVFDFKITGMDQEVDLKINADQGHSIDSNQCPQNINSDRLGNIFSEPPPIPPKCNPSNHIDIERKTNVENYSVPKIQHACELKENSC